MASHRPKAVLFLNPAAAGSRSRPGEAPAILAEHFDLAVHATRNEEAMEAMAAREARWGCGLVIAGGGDGTVNVIVNAIAGTGAALGILPIGTANDLARQLGIPRTAELAAQRIISGCHRRFDVGAVNGRRFCTVGALGLVTECAVVANRLRSVGHPLRPLARCLGPAIYPVVGVSTILLGRRRAWDVNLIWTEDGGEQRGWRTQMSGMFFANQRSFGGGLTLPIRGCNDDGGIEICSVAAASKSRLLRTLFALRTASPINGGVMTVHRAVRARIESQEELGFLGDGELLCVGKHFELEVLPGALSVVC